jgi:hypothetical protein
MVVSESEIYFGAEILSHLILTRFVFKVDNYANKIANTFSTIYNLKKGDTIALFMDNRPEYVCIWLGLAKIGVISALINTNLKSTALAHSVKISNSKIVIYGHELNEGRVEREWFSYLTV